MNEIRACRRNDVDPDWWHADGYYARWQTKRAKEICRTCPLVTRCLADNLHEPWGVWGATDERERKALREKAGKR